MTYSQVIKKLKSLSSKKNVEGMKRFGIKGEKMLGISVVELRKIAKEIGKDHKLSQQLWNSGIHEARILASFVEDPKLVNEAQMEKWVGDFDSWDVCDQVCGLFDKTEFAHKKAVQWSGRKEEFVKRAGFAMMAWIAVHDKKASDEELIKFLPIIKREANDERNFVRKAVNWALRQIGKRNKKLNKEALKKAKEIQDINSKSAKWIARDAIRELESEVIQKRLKSK